MIPNQKETDLKQLRIMVVDDDEVFRQQLAKALERRNLLVHHASDLKTATEIIGNFKIDLAVVDLKLKTESGLAILAKLKQLQPRSRAVILTGYGTIATAVQALKLGAVNYVTKPAGVDAILAALSIDIHLNNKKLPTPSLEQVEWDHLQRVVNEYDGNITQAAKALGLHRRSLQRKLAKQPNKIQ